MSTKVTISMVERHKLARRFLTEEIVIIPSDYEDEFVKNPYGAVRSIIEASVRKSKPILSGEEFGTG